MKKGILYFAFLLLSIMFLASCQSHGPKCPGMYSSTPQVETKAQ